MNGFIVGDLDTLVIGGELLYTRKQILENRKRWIDFLMTKGRKKAKYVLDNGGGARCCLGHGCYALGIKPRKDEINPHIIWYDDHTEIAPQKFIELVGLWDDTGSTEFGTKLEFSEDRFFCDLASINDESDATPREIGKYLLSVINGGPDTPFRPIEDYPE